MRRNRPWRFLEAFVSTLTLPPPLKAASVTPRYVPDDSRRYILQSARRTARQPSKTRFMMRISTCSAAIGLALLITSAARAQLPPGVYAGEHDYRLATAGDYGLDAGHTAVLAEVSHIGYSLSVFRFDKVEGTLKWDPARPDASHLSVSVDTASIDTPVPNFAKELSGAGFLNASAFPKATFVSTAFHQIDASHGRVEGAFTLMGKSVPMTFDVELLGAGKGFMGHPRIGIEARARLKTADFGLPPVLGSTIQLVVDSEFAK
jgi:polyisoprenoid-binding protein YceI